MTQEIEKKILPIFKQLQEIFMGPKTGDEQPDTTDMPDLECEKSAEQRGQGLKLLTPSQMLSRLPISLAQLKAGNNSEKLKKDNCCILCSVQRNYPKQSILV